MLRTRMSRIASAPLEPRLSVVAAIALISRRDARKRLGPAATVDGLAPKKARRKPGSTTPFNYSVSRCIRRTACPDEV